MKTIKYNIYQLPVSNPNCFRGINGFVNTKRETVKLIDYVHVYEGTIGTRLTKETQILELIFQELNVDHPKDYFARSLSVSDIVCLQIDGSRQWYYVDSFGFEKFEESELVRD